MATATVTKTTRKTTQNTEAYQVRFRRLADPGYFPALLYIYSGLAIPYLAWRTGIVNWHIWYGPMMYMADVYGIFTTILFLVIAQKAYKPVHRSMTPGKRIVDVLIPTYNEPLSVVEPTVLGALKVRGIRNVLLLDDGNRPEMRAMAQRLGIAYHPRTTNEHAKAGNMNNGLKYTDAELLMTLDADHIPLPEFLERTLGYFDDNGVAFVQTPQTYYNTESFLFRRRRGTVDWSEQVMFYDCIQPCKNRWNSSFFVGTSAVLRRAALDDVGGFATGTATEDIHTSLRLHARGWKSVFVPEALAYGLEAASLAEFYKQRRRWSAGSLGLLFRSPDSPLRARGLSIGQRLNYISATLAHLQGVQKLIYFVTPVLVITTLVGPVNIAYASFNLIFVAFTGLALWVTHKYSRGTYHLLYTESYSLANMMAHFGGIRGIIRVQKKFVVSRKTTARHERSWLTPTMWALLVLGLYGMARSCWLLAGGNHSGLVLSALLFCTFNSMILLNFLVYLGLYERNDPQLPVHATLEPPAKYEHIAGSFGEAVLSEFALADEE